MRKVLWATLFVVMLLSALPSYAQNPNYDVGPVWRVSYYHLKPGMGDVFWKDVREHLKPIFDSLKKEGLLSDYKFWTNDTTDRPGDGLDAKAATIVAKHYGSRDAMIEAAKKRADFRELVMSKLAREVMPK
jgi:hypothetical protein